MKQQHKAETDYNYAGITIHAAEGLHEFAMDVILKTCPPKAHILDLGCGSGAFTERLQDHGFSTTSVDLSLDTFRLDTDRYELDFNADFAERLAGKKFDAIVALEVIEHLENPLHFLRQLKLIANPDTLNFVSFPNIKMYPALVMFFKEATFGNWSPYLYWETGHQTIIPDWLFEEHLKKTGLALEEKHFCAPISFPPNPVGRFVHWFFLNLVCIFTRKIPSEARRNEAVLYLIRNRANSS